jgi:Zn-dependent protease
MNWNIKLGRWLGIDVYLHFTFVLLLAFIGISHGLPERSLAAGLAGALFFSSIFLCVLLHEFGHSLAARRFGIETKDIILLPIGGVARLARMPDRPLHELWIALAGPAVNVVIMVVLGCWLLLTNTFEPLSSLSTNRGGLVERLLIVNGFLVAFNLLPAFPMDGGRVLRSLLALKTDHTWATLIAGRIGQAFAVGFGLFGLVSNPFLLLVAVFIWMGASQEIATARMSSQGYRRPSPPPLPVKRVDNLCPHE